MAYYLGIDLGGTNIVAGVVDENYKIVQKLAAPTNAVRPFEDVVCDMVQTARTVVKNCGLLESDIKYVGIGAPSSINPHNNNVVFAVNLGWKDKDLCTEFKKHWDIPVNVGNDADCAALGEALAGGAKSHKSALMITLGTGVGGGFVVNGKVFLGGDGFGVEFGHVTLTEDGVPCSCGRRGCFEAYASVNSLIRQTVQMMSIFPHSSMWNECGQDLNRVNGRTAFDAAKKGDVYAKEVVDTYIGHVGAGISGLVCALRPHIVLIGGGVSGEGEYLLAPVRKIVQKTVYAHDIIQPPEVEKAALGNDAGIIGAALLQN